MSSSSYTRNTSSAAVFICECNEWMRSACKGEIFYREHEGKHYCVLHYPGEEKSRAFALALKRKLDAHDFNFQGVWFPDPLDFSDFIFNVKANFSHANFNSTAYFARALFFTEASFRFATFSTEPNFSYVTFSAKADFSGAAFGAVADFSNATFKGSAIFYKTAFSAVADFSYATFSVLAIFSEATFDNHIEFAGDVERHVFVRQSSLDLQFARIANPDYVSFHTLTLRPHWFVNMDARKFDFTNVDWDWRDTNDEVESLKAKKISSPHRMLAIACRQLAVNAEENNRYEEASKFRYMAMDARRLKWQEGLRGKFFKAQSTELVWALAKTSIRLYRAHRCRGLAKGRTRIRFKRFLRVYWKDFDLLHWLYWAASGYGEKITRAFLLLLGIWFAFALLYLLTGHIIIRRATDLLSPVNYSLSVMALQKPEPKSVAGLTPLLITFETILGPVQAALLALAIRRKFMR